ncbi:zinc-dependent metalloprotease [Microvirga sp. STS02]|uniref:zinc-dependent metalloprotease n=1 Tax=Hymenobacter negativus TaxID=2795026 RepID=UPI0018DC9856|nr:MULTISPECIES: zinc-dependent metalloprotease [Bacteria]MBH8571320.1 zinc-dependent metalloprotease [Hymenobacter negativus]MBR7211058.1 zinc-dependent metalloprotease [Microvirga sp. STS02]
MRSLRTFLSLLCGLVVGTAHGQSAQIQPCGTPAPSAHQLQELLLRVLPYEQRTAAKVATVVTYIPVKVHIVRRSDGSGGIDETQIYQGMAASNEQFILAHMQFYMAGQVTYIDNTQYYDFASQDETAISQANDVPNVINLYYTHTASFQGSPVGGYCTSRIFLTNPHANLDRSFTHEFGHFFGLIHTFDQSNSGTIANRELVARTNCQTTGDWVCDTPADPSERPGATYLECEYVGTITDAQGALYSPPTRNAMAFNFCGNQLTAGQLTRMETWRTLYYPNLTSSLTPPATPTSLTAVVSTVGTAQFQQVRLQWQNNATNAVGYFIERATPTSDYAAVGAVGPTQNVFVDQAAPANQVVSYRVKPINAAAAWSNVASINSGLSYAKPLYVNKDCLAGSTYYQDADYVEEVHLNQGATPLIANVNIPCGPYNQFATAVVPLSAGTSYSGSFKAKFQNNGYYDQQYLAIWIDFNRNGRFDDVGERVFIMPNAPVGTTLPIVQPFSFTVPGGVANGLTRMRMRSLRRDTDGNVWDPAARAWAGAVEDYTVQIQGGTVSAVLNSTGGPLHVYPNPVADQLTVELPTGMVWEGVALRDVQGRAVACEVVLSPGFARLSLRACAPGLYVLEARSAQGVVHQRVVRQ